MAFMAAAQRHVDRIGIVHLALHVHDGGLVTAWQQSVESVAEPGVRCAPMAKLQMLGWVLSLRGPSAITEVAACKHQCISDHPFSR
jgi:hypothetical protein